MTARQNVAAHPLPDTGVPLPLRYFDCVLVLAFVPFGLLASLPALGVVGGAVIWLALRALGVAIDGYASRQDDFRRATALTFAGGMLRPLLAGLTILALGQLGEREDGLTAALIALAAFTVYMILSFIFRPQRNA
jgi:predicted permease